MNGSFHESAFTKVSKLTKFPHKTFFVALPSHPRLSKTSFLFTFRKYRLSYDGYCEINEYIMLPKETLATN